MQRSGTPVHPNQRVSNTRAPYPIWTLVGAASVTRGEEGGAVCTHGAVRRPGAVTRAVARRRQTACRRTGQKICVTQGIHGTS